MSWTQRKCNRLLLSKACSWESEWWEAQPTGSHGQDGDDGGLALAGGPWCSEIGKSGLVPLKAGMAELWLGDWGCLVKTLHPCGSSRCERSRGDDGDHKCVDTNWAPSYLNLYMGCFPTTLSRGRKLIKRKSSKRLGAKPTPARSLRMCSCKQNELKIPNDLRLSACNTLSICVFHIYATSIYLWQNGIRERQESWINQANWSLSIIVH